MNASTCMLPILFRHVLGDKTCCREPMVAVAMEEVLLGGEVFRVGDTVLVRGEDRAEPMAGAAAMPAGARRRVVARIVALWEDDGVQSFAGHVYYAPEETRLGRLEDHEPSELFMTTHKIEDTVDAIEAYCTVKTWEEYQVWLDQPIDNVDDGEWPFVCRASYDPLVDEFHPLGRARTRA